MPGEFPSVDINAAPFVTQDRAPWVSWQLKGALKDVVSSWGQTVVEENGGECSQGFLELANGEFIGIFLGKAPEAAHGELFIAGNGGFMVDERDVVYVSPTKKNPERLLWDSTVDPETVKDAIRIVDSLAVFAGLYDLNAKKRKPVTLPIETQETVLRKVLSDLNLGTVSLNSLSEDAKSEVNFQVVGNLAAYLGIRSRLEQVISEKFEPFIQDVIAESQLTREEFEQMDEEQKNVYMKKAGEAYARSLAAELRGVQVDE